MCDTNEFITEKNVEQIGTFIPTVYAGVYNFSFSALKLNRNQVAALSAVKWNDSWVEPNLSDDCLRTNIAPYFKSGC